MKILLAFILTVVVFGTNAETWEYQRSLNPLVGSNYIDFTKHTDGKIYYVTNTNYKVAASMGKVWVQSHANFNSTLSSAWNPISKSDMAQYEDQYGNPMDYVRTIGIESYGDRCYLLMHVGAQYGSGNYYYVPAFADSDDCINWEYHGPVTVNGVYRPYIFSSSSAYFIEDGFHYMAQDNGSYGAGRLVIYYSTDGLDYTQITGDVSYFPEDRVSFPDMEYCNGKYHMLYEEGWQSTYPLIEEIRHLIAEPFSLWHLQEEVISVRDFKGMNISCIDDELYGISERRLYKWE